MTDQEYSKDNVATTDGDRAGLIDVVQDLYEPLFRDSEAASENGRAGDELTPEIKTALVKYKPDLLARLAGVGLRFESESPGLAGLDCQRSEPFIAQPTVGFEIDRQPQANSLATPEVVEVADDHSHLERAAIERHKVYDYLGCYPDDDVAELDTYEFEERAAILEYDGGHSREEAERRARIELGPPASPTDPPPGSIADWDTW
jgi:hypothetical protein